MLALTCHVSEENFMPAHSLNNVLLLCLGVIDKFSTSAIVPGDTQLVCDDLSSLPEEVGVLGIGVEELEHL